MADAPDFQPEVPKEFKESPALQNDRSVINDPAKNDAIREMTVTGVKGDTNLPNVEVSKTGDASVNAGQNEQSSLTAEKQKFLPEQTLPNSDDLFAKAMQGTPQDQASLIAKIEPAIKATQNHISGLERKINSSVYSNN